MANHRDGTVERREAILNDAIAAMLREHGPGTSVATTARAIGTSVRQLQRVFAEQSEHTFRETIAAIRMRHARRLLADTEAPIAEIGREVGYATASQFSKAFRQHHGVPPRAYRANRAARRAQVADPRAGRADAAG